MTAEERRCSGPEECWYQCPEHDGFRVQLVEEIAKARYKRYDSHYSMPGGLTWKQYSNDDPDGADSLYRADAHADLDSIAALLAAHDRVAAAKALRDAADLLNNPDHEAESLVDGIRWLFARADAHEQETP